MIRFSHLMVAAALAFCGPFAIAENQKTVTGSVKEAAQDTGKAVKKMGRNVKDEVCEMVNGKMECMAKKVKHKVQNVGDELKDKSND